MAGAAGWAVRALGCALAAWLVSFGAARADEAPPVGVVAQPPPVGTCAPDLCRRPTVCGPDWMRQTAYVPAVPINETRAAITAIVTPPSPFSGSLGEALTPPQGLWGLRLERLSDERSLGDLAGNVYESDGEVQITTLEFVSPRWVLSLGGVRVPMHAGASLTAYSLHTAWFDGLRNWVEETFLDADQVVLDAHGLGGKDLYVETPALERTELLGSSPMLKAKGFVKFELPPLHVGCSCVRTSLGLGVTTPAFGSHAESGNTDWQPEAVFAFAAPLASRLRWTGAASVAWTGGSETYDEVGLETEDVASGACTNLEYWFSWRFAVAVGLSWNSSWTRDSGLPTDLDSVYMNLGVLYRLSRCVDLALTFSENPEATIATAPGSDFNDSQKDSDFALALGLRFIP